MIYPPVNDLIKHAGSRYALVIATAKRARELSQGAEPLVDDKSNKCVSVAIKEINESKINVFKGEERNLNSEVFRKLAKTGVILDDETSTIYADADIEDDEDDEENSEEYSESSLSIDHEEEIDPEDIY